MTDPEIFDREMRPYGGRLNRVWPKGSLSERSYGTMSAGANSLIASARQHVAGLPHIHFDYVLNGEPNAWAFKADGRYFIGITTGLRYLLELVFSRMLADSRLFPLVGDPSAEASHLPSITGYLPHAQKMSDAGVKPTPPRTPVRFAYVDLLLHHAFHFLLGHEIAHISHGHIDYWGSRGAKPFIEEMGLTDTDEAGLIERQTLEGHADQRSVRSGIAAAKLMHEAMEAHQRPWASSGEAPGDMLFHWAIAINSLFRLFGDGRFSASELAGRNYPPLPLRRKMAMDIALVSVTTGWDAVPKETARPTLASAAYYTEDAFSAILGENPTQWGFPDAQTPLSLDHCGR